MLLHFARSCGRAAELDADPHCHLDEAD